MIKLNGKEKILAACVGLLLTLFAIKNFALGPIYEKTGVYSKEIELSKMAMRKYLALEYNRAEILKAKQQIKGYSSLTGTDEEKSSMVMSKLEAASRASKLQILDMSTSGASKIKGGVTLYRVGLRAEGQLKNVLDFIAQVEDESILLQVEKIAFSVKDEAAATLKIELTVSGVSFS